MSMGLTNSKFAMGQPAQRPGLVSRKHKVTTSIAEGAIFIPKPHKRVKFEMNLPGSGATGANKRSFEPIPLPGSTPGGKANVVDSMKSGGLGVNGLTARFNTAAHTGGASQGYTKVTIDFTPDKQTDVIATQEEGRQVNNSAIHFSQQYDSYGRPRIGFSREPYDFAATKFMSVTSQISFQQNTSETRDRFNAYLLNGAGSENVEPQVMGQEGPKSNEVPIFGSTSESDANLDANVELKNFFLGPQPGADVGFNHVDAEESFERQKVEPVETLGDDSSGGGHAIAPFGSGAPEVSADELFGGPIDADKLKMLDVSV